MQAVILSRKGSKSDKNEDACLSLPMRGLFVVADGVGGGPAGDFASRAVVDTLYESLTESECTRESILQSIERANDRVYAAARREGFHGMASTVVVGWKCDDQVVCFNVGDSRGYLVRSGSIMRLTRDHTRQIQKAPNVVKQVVTNAVGINPSINVEVTSFPLNSGDILLLASDGISDQLDDDTIMAIVSTENLSFAEKARALVDASEERGGRDDKSVIIAFNE
ncbi:MAG: protein phosphatase 2C domain-containing protein [Gammaproteobacteria bacterium]